MLVWIDTVLLCRQIVQVSQYLKKKYSNKKKSLNCKFYR